MPISYPAHWVKTMSFHYTHSYEQYKSHIAPARTYGFTHEIEMFEKIISKRWKFRQRIRDRGPRLY